MYKNDHAYFKYEVEKCQEEKRNITLKVATCVPTEEEPLCETVDPPCATPDEIKAWLKTKRIALYMINEKTDWKDFKGNGKSKRATRQSQEFLPSVPLASGKYSESWYRFRRNTFDRLDDWIPFMAQDRDTSYDTNV